MANRMILNETAWFGRGAVGALTDEVKRRGYQKAVIVTDKTLVQCGVVAKVTDKMDAAGLAWAIYDGVVYLTTLAITDPVPVLSDEEIAVVLEKFKTYGLRIEE